MANKLATLPLGNERVILCGSVREDDLLVNDHDPLRLRRWGPDRNVYLKIEALRRAMYKAVPTAFVDLIDIATYVYCADQAIRRGNGGSLAVTDEKPEIGQNWRRKLHFRIPVRNPDLWKSKEVLNHLVSTLSFLSEDEYLFEFEHLQKDHSLEGYIDFGSTPFDGLIEEVVPFSGGLDSLAGAVQESVIDKRKVLLVHHRSTEKLTRRHHQLLDLLEKHGKDKQPLHLPVRINKDKTLGREYTQRSRSFLYASLGATIATMIGLNRIRFYENGVISLNLPPSAQVVGARATRTTHPQVLNGMAKLLTTLAGKPFGVENPFRWKTKTEVIQLLADAGCGEMIKYSTSCTHTWETTKQHTHCGTCSQCIDRRFAVLAAGQEANDPGEAYGVDLLVGERTDGDPKAMIAAYLETANEINTMQPLQFFGRFGEAARVLRQFEGSAETTALQIFELYKRHAKQVTRVVDQAISRHAAEIRLRNLPANCLIRLVVDTGNASNGKEPDEPHNGSTAIVCGDYIFRKKGQVWALRFAGGEEQILLPSKGAAYLHILLSNPGTPFSAIDLACRVARRRQEYALSDAGEKIDQEAMTAYKARYAELEEEMEEAKTNNDSGQKQRVQSEMTALAAEIQKAKDRGGKLKKDSDDRERVRKAVGNAIRTAVKAIAQFDKRMAEHLKTPRLCCGNNPMYMPTDGVVWVT